MSNKLPLSYSPFFLAMVSLLFIACNNEKINSGKKPTELQTTWHLKILNDKPVTAESANLCFISGSNKISGFTGCNRLTGSYFIEPGKVEISPAAATRISCPEEETIEKEFLATLVKSDSLTIESDSLKLYCDATMTAVFSK